MRVSTQYQYDLYLQQVSDAQSAYSEAQKRVMTGHRFSLASEDPAGAQFVMRASSLKAQTDQFDKNLRSAKDYLGATENAFTEVGTLFNQAYTIALNGANSSYDQASRDGMAQQVGELQKRLVSLANSRGSQNQFIFGGQISDSAPFTVTPPTLTFSGDDNPVNVETRPGEFMRVNLQGAGTMFTQMYADLENLRNDLLSGNVSQLGNQDVPALQAEIQQATMTRGDMGSKLQTVQGLADENQRRSDDLTKGISDTQDVDLARALTDMKSAETAYMAALQVTARGQSLSLMDFLK